MELGRAKAIASEVVKRLSPYCQRIEVAGSIRRQEPVVKDIEIILIPSDAWNLSHEIMGLGPSRATGDKLERVSYDGVRVNLDHASKETWATLLLIRTGSNENNIRLCSLGEKKGWYLAVTGNGLFDENGRRIAVDTEESIYEALGAPWQEPWERR